MKIDRDFCSSAYLMFRSLYPYYNYSFSNKLIPNLFLENEDRKKIYNSIELEKELKFQIEKNLQLKNTCIALSGGIDSAILAKFMPKGSVAYTFKCIVPGIEVIDESIQAAKYAKECGLEHRIVEIYWEDFEELAPKLMIRKGAPIHSIEVQIAKASLQAKKDGFDAMIYGESADINYGGMNSLLSKEYLVSEFLERYSYVLPYQALKKPVMIMEPFLKFSQNGIAEVHEFIRDMFYCEAMGTYTNSINFANVEYVAPFSKTYMGIHLDVERIRKGENKYLVREIFERLYPNFEIPKKIPMPRPMNEWMANWIGPQRDEFLPNCHKNMTGDQKWMLWSLETFLNILDEEESK